jgi:hypothetical protein
MITSSFASEIYTKFLDFEANCGDLTSYMKVEKRKLSMFNEVQHWRLCKTCSLYYVFETIKELTYKQIQIQTLSILASIQIIRRNGPFSKEFCLLTSQKESPFVDPALCYTADREKLM